MPSFTIWFGLAALFLLGCTFFITYRRRGLIFSLGITFVGLLIYAVLYLGFVSLLLRNMG